MIWTGIQIPLSSPQPISCFWVAEVWPYTLSCIHSTSIYGAPKICKNSLSTEHKTGGGESLKETFKKIQHPFIIKMINERGLEENFLNLIKNFFRNLQLTSCLVVKEWMHSPKNRKNIQGCSLLPCTVLFILYWRF